MIKTVEALIAKGKAIAATVLETAEADIEYRDGRFGVVGTDRSITLFDLAARAKDLKKRGEIPEDLDTKVNAETPLTFPNGMSHCRGRDRPEDRRAHARELCRGRRLRQRAQHHDRRGPDPRLDRAGAGPGDDGGRGVRRSGGSSSPARHGLRHAAADDMPAFKDALHLVPATTNPLGVKGAGEAGTTAAIAAVMNAIADAIPGGAGAISTCRRRRRSSGRRARRRATLISKGRSRADHPRVGSPRSGPRTRMARRPLPLGDELGVEVGAEPPMPPSLPCPDSLTPPNGVSGVETVIELTPTMPDSMASPIAAAVAFELVKA